MIACMACQEGAAIVGHDVCLTAIDVDGFYMPLAFAGEGLDTLCSGEHWLHPASKCLGGSHGVPIHIEDCSSIHPCGSLYDIA